MCMELANRRKGKSNKSEVQEIILYLNLVKLDYDIISYSARETFLDSIHKKSKQELSQKVYEIVGIYFVY